MIRALIEAWALERALHDGVPVAVVHVHAAASDLVAEIAREKDAAIAALLRPAPAPQTSPAAPVAADVPAALPAPAAAPDTTDAPAAAPEGGQTAEPASAPQVPA
jgi:hypothetical protein